MIASPAQGTPAEPESGRLGSLLRSMLLLAAAIGVVFALFHVVGGMRNTFNRAGTDLGTVTLPLAAGPVLVERSGDEATVLAVLHPFAGIPRDGAPSPGRVVRITAPANEVVAILGTEVPPKDQDLMRKIMVNAAFAKATIAQVTDAETGALVTMDTLGDRRSIRASHVGIAGELTVTQP